MSKEESSPLLSNEGCRESSTSGKPLVLNSRNQNLKEPSQFRISKGTPNWRIWLGTAYMCAMGVCGIVLTAIGSTLTKLATDCGSTALKVSTVFLARGAGAILGSFLSAKLYVWFHGNYVVVAALIWLAIIMLCLPFCDRVWYLHCLFAALGFGTAVTDTGCQIMTRKAHGKAAGPWLGANTVTFGIAGAIVPLMEIWTSSLITQFSILAGMTLLSALGLMIIPVPSFLSHSMDQNLSNRAAIKDKERDQRKPAMATTMMTRDSGCDMFDLNERQSDTGACISVTNNEDEVVNVEGHLENHDADVNDDDESECNNTICSGKYWYSIFSSSIFSSSSFSGVAMSFQQRLTSIHRGCLKYSAEQTLAAAVFCLIGGKVTFSSYIKLYIGDTGVIAKNHESLGLAALWISITVGRLGGLWDQINIGSKSALYNHIYAWLLIGCLGMIVIMTWHSSAIALWIGILLYGFGNGPCVGYCSSSSDFVSIKDDINNRITLPSEFGMSIVMMGLNLGASLVPYLTAMAWNDSGKAFWLPFITFLTMLFPICLVRLTKVFQKEEIGLTFAIEPSSGDILDGHSAPGAGDGP